jgi:hypothetical protein
LIRRQWWDEASSHPGLEKDLSLGALRSLIILLERSCAEALRIYKEGRAQLNHLF